MKSKKFTLLELLVAMAVFSVMMTVLMQFFSSAQKVTLRTKGKTNYFEDARTAMELMSRDLKSALYAGTGKELKITNSNKTIEFYCYSQNSITRGQLAKVTYTLDESDASNKILKISVANDSTSITDSDVIGKVQSLTFTPALHPDGSTYSGGTTPGEDQYYNILPGAVSIDLKVGESLADSVTFSKTIYLAGRGQGTKNEVN